MKKKIIIFGAGVWGRIAYDYCRDNCEIICFLDNDQELWGTSIFGVRIDNPDILKNIKQDTYTILIACKDCWKKIQQQLYSEYNIENTILFRAHIDFDMLGYKEKEYRDFEDIIFIKYQGGLGNQMFQYAFAQNFEKQGKRVVADLASYIFLDKRKFELTRVFPNITLEECNYDMKAIYSEKTDFLINEEKKLCFSNQILKKKMGYLNGYWQSYKYTELVEDELREKFEFYPNNENSLIEIQNEIKKTNSIALHIRRGDYLQKKERKAFGDICTLEYYQKSISYMLSHVENSRFFVFSDDIEWVKENISITNAWYMDKKIFKNYENWYDMYLMSCCKHNIIANSTFSWWGAWLNKNANKIVIAPKKWNNMYTEQEICPLTWIRI